jgi:hypothetical protein
MTACTALGPNKDAAANTGDWKYETPAAEKTATSMMNVKKV